MCICDARWSVSSGFNGHPPLGVNATGMLFVFSITTQIGFNGHPPLGVNATGIETHLKLRPKFKVSTGTHPWG